MNEPKLYDVCHACGHVQDVDKNEICEKCGSSDIEEYEAEHEISLKAEKQHKTINKPKFTISKAKIAYWWLIFIGVLISYILFAVMAGMDDDEFIVGLLFIPIYMLFVHASIWSYKVLKAAEAGL